MSMLSLIPEFVVHGLVVLGITGIILSLFLQFLPFVRKYAAAFITIFSVILMCGVYLEGGLTVEKEYELKVSELEKKITKLEGESKLTNHIVDTVYVDRIKYVEKKGKDIVKHVPIYVTNADDAQCTIPESAMILHNESAKREYK